MPLIFTQLQLALPEIVLLGSTCLVLIVDLFVSERSRGITYILAQMALLAVFITLLATSVGKTSDAFSHTFVRDALGDTLKLFVALSCSVVFLYAKNYLKTRDIPFGEFYVLGLFGVLGMMILISAASLLTVYLGLELLSLSMYAMVALQRDSVTASESAMKYFVLGAIASGMLLYGMSMIYGMTGSLELATINTKVLEHQHDIVMMFGLVFVLVGIAFKFGAVPFHMWVPDVYQGSATAVTLYIGTAPKIAAFAMLIRLLVDGLLGLQSEWRDIVIVIAIASMAIGNVVAIAQSNIKRMLAYSTISHVGFLMLGVLAGTPEGFASAMFYTLVYTLTALGSFGMVILMSGYGFEAEHLDSFKGLNQRSPWFAFIMLILMFSMAGVPPFLGFFAKFMVLKSVVAIDLVWLAALAVVFSIVGAFYYLRIVKLMYFDTAQDSHSLEISTDMRLLMSVNGLLVLLLGLKPDWILDLCIRVFPLA
ncbi:MAG: NADH-quinone oxidoreductase subunit NuoN [Gammaproteobacteria bacterium]|nr:NADH-quinone oxidoreductase subunit NuoN [Gammaproteobacteria bacterium]